MINSVGDQVERGRYFSHSSFERVVNFYPESEKIGLLAVAKNSVGPGPKTICADDQLVKLAANVKEIVVYDDRIDFISKSQIHTYPYLSNSYQSSLSENELEQSSSYELELCTKVAMDEAPEHSFVFLLNSEREKNFTGAFDKALIERVKAGVDQLFDQGNLVEGIKLLKGVGNGLTPSGDDFITGLLAAISLIECKEQYKFHNIKQVIREHAIGGNPFSNTYIDLAARGFFTAPVKNLLLAIGNANDVEQRTKELINFGHSSGADLIAGILLGLKRRTSWLLKD